MKPTYKIIGSCEECRSSFDQALRFQEIEQQLIEIVESKTNKRILDSIIPLYVYAFVNPPQETLTDALSYGGSIFVKASNDISNDFTMYSIFERCRSIKLPLGVTSCLLEFSTYEKKSVTTGTDSGEKRDKPVFIAKESKSTFEDIVLPEEVYKRILRACSIIKHKDLIFKQWGFERIDKNTKSIICLYGAPGTGKTRAAEAISNHLGKKIIKSSYAQIESEFVGVGAKNLHAIFEAAKEQDAVLFFDEADSFLSKRLDKTGSSSDKHYNRMSNELFQLLEDFDGCVIFATNLLSDVDRAFKSRIIDSIRFELPDHDARMRIINLMLPKEFPLKEPLSIDKLESLVSISDGFSGRDIRKSMLLSLATAADKYETDSSVLFSIDDLSFGFNEVLKANTEMEEEISGIELNPELGQALLDEQIFNEKLISMAKLALNVDSVNNQLAVDIFKELTRSILGIESDDLKLTDKDNLATICNDVEDKNKKIELLDIAIKVVSADGSITEKESTFLMDVMSLLSVPTDKVKPLLDYSENVAMTNNQLLSIKNHLFV